MIWIKMKIWYKNILNIQLREHTQIMNGWIRKFNFIWTISNNIIHLVINLPFKVIVCLRKLILLAKICLHMTLISNFNQKLIIKYNKKRLIAKIVTNFLRMTRLVIITYNIYIKIFLLNKFLLNLYFLVKIIVQYP
jgi:hypothetical protein